jgi:hypothetical protein
MDETRGGFIIQLVQAEGDFKFLWMRLELPCPKVAFWGVFGARI